MASVAAAWLPVSKHSLTCIRFYPSVYYSSPEQPLLGGCRLLQVLYPLPPFSRIVESLKMKKCSLMSRAGGLRRGVTPSKSIQTHSWDPPSENSSSTKRLANISSTAIRKCSDTSSTIIIQESCIIRAMNVFSAMTRNFRFLASCQT